MEATLIGLEQRIEKLLNECSRIKAENNLLKKEHQALLMDKAQLTEKNRLACDRLEQIVGKLRLMEDQ